VPPQVFFLAARPGQRLCVHHAPQTGAPRGLVLYLHPWAEEMNKSRRMSALQARALAQSGFAVLQIDLHGCGDSSDTWAEASWDGWVDDAQQALAWLNARWPGSTELPLWLWGLRAGCLLASQLAARLDRPCHLLLWQPATAGKQLLQQFLRLKAAADLQGDAKSILAATRAGLAAGQTQQVAGYALSPALASGLELAQLAPPPGHEHTAAGAQASVVWLEVSTRDDASLLPASQTLIAAWTAAGHGVHSAVVHGPAFWQTQEIEDAPALLDATLAALQQTQHAHPPHGVPA
jgi:exosortase A-associated hydrolase 2